MIENCHLTSLFLPPVLSFTLQLEEGQHWVRAYVRGGAYCHQKLPPHQRTVVGPGGQVHSGRQARTAQPLKQVRRQLMQPFAKKT